MFMVVICDLRRNEINIAGARRGTKGRNSKPEWLSQGPTVLGEGAYHPSHQLGGLRECCDLPDWSPGQSPGRQEFW